MTTFEALSTAEIEAWIEANAATAPALTPAQFAVVIRAFAPTPRPTPHPVQAKRSRRSSTTTGSAT